MTTQTEARPPWRPADSLGNRLVLIRRELNLTQRSAAMQTGVTFGTWQGMEDGRSPHRLDEVVAKISASLGVDRDWLMWGSGAAGTSYPPTTERSSGDSRTLSPALVAA